MSESTIRKSKRMLTFYKVLDLLRHLNIAPLPTLLLINTQIERLRISKLQ